MLYHCLSASIISDEKLAVIQVIVPACKVLFFSGCFQDFLFLFGFQQFDYDVPRCFSLILSC